jgi:hypothetical protein
VNTFAELKPDLLFRLGHCELCLCVAEALARAVVTIAFQFFNASANFSHIGAHWLSVGFGLEDIGE